MDFDSIYQLLRSLWLVWLIVLFLGIVAWVMWPKRKKELEDQAQIPFKDDRE
jgi:cytochrome c oxidase cbb3-type subunit 4